MIGIDTSSDYGVERKLDSTKGLLLARDSSTLLEASIAIAS